MATLQKTYKGDLSTAIVGKLWEAIKDVRDKKKNPNASKEIKQEAKKLNDEDTDKGIPVRDSDLRKTIINIFRPLDTKFLQTESKIDNLSSKVTLVAGGISDTQKLIINRNQLFEDKFDQMLKHIGGVDAIEKQRAAEAAYENLETQLEKGLDLSSTFAFTKLRSGSYGILGKLLGSILFNRFGSQAFSRIVGSVVKRFVPRSIRARGRLLRKALLPARKFAKNLRNPGRFIAKRFIQPFAMHTAKQIGDLGGLKFLTKPLSKGMRFGSRSLGRFFGKTKFGRRALRFGSGLLKSPVDSVVRNIIKWNRFKTASKAGKRLLGISAKKTPNKLKSTLVDGVFWLAMKSPVVRKALLKKLGKKGLERIGIKIAAGGTKGGFPLVGTAYAVGEGLVRLMMGDPKGMALSFGSGIPAAGWGFAIIDILRDIDVEAYTAHIEPNLPLPSDENIAAFFQQALGLSPDQYERGNIQNLSISPGGMGTSASAISEILGVTKAFGEAAGFGAEVGGLIGEAGLSSYPSGSNNYTFDVSGDIGGAASVNEQSKEAELKKQEEPEKEEEETTDDDGDKGPSVNERIMQFLSTGMDWTTEKIGEGIQWTDEKLDFVRQWTGGERDDGYYQLWNWKVKNPLSDVWKNGDGGDPSVVANNQLLGGSGTTIEFHGQQGKDLSGEPGVDFSFSDYKNNYSLFPGTVLETGLLYGSGYGNVVVVRSIDPSNGQQFDSLYSHFPDGGIAVSPGQQVSAGQLLGAVGFVSVDTPGVPQLQPNNAGNMSGWHTSVDFFEPDSAARYSNADAIINLIMGASGSTPNGLLEKLKPTGDGGNVSALNNIGANSNLSTAMTSMVENGSSERLMKQRNGKKRLPIVIVNNQIVNTNSTLLNFGGNQENSDFFEAYNLARYTV